MTRATRFVLAAGCLFAVTQLTAELLAQNYQPAAPQQVAPQQNQPGANAQPVRASVYGPAIGPAAPQNRGQVQPAQAQQVQPQQGGFQFQPAQAQVQAGQMQAGQIRPVAGQQPIRQPGAAGPQPIGPGPLNVPRAAIVQAMPQQPAWYPLDPKVQDWVDTVLRFWEERSNKVKTLECKFQKWEYDPGAVAADFQRLKALGKLNELPFSKYARGVIKYAAPDKGLFKVEQLQVIVPGQQQADGKQKYDVQPAENGEHWVTDGKNVFAFDAVNKEVIESQLPPEMQGKALADGPLPFMFGARAESIKARYWIRPLQPEGAGEYCLEAVPKSRQDASNFKMVQIVLDEKQYLPTRMQIFEGDWTPANPHRTAYRFDDRKENAEKDALNQLLNPLNLKLNPWAQAFFNVATPRGWKRIVRDANGNIVGGGAANTATAPSIGPALK
jgi:TIGR03009 family protein